jgi:hypothetical protein
VRRRVKRVLRSSAPAVQATRARRFAGVGRRNYLDVGGVLLQRRWGSTTAVGVRGDGMVHTPVGDEEAADFARRTHEPGNNEPANDE